MTSDAGDSETRISRLEQRMSDIEKKLERFAEPPRVVYMERRPRSTTDDQVPDAPGRRFVYPVEKHAWEGQ